MRTTVDVPDHLLAQAKQLAIARRSSLTAIVADSLRMYLTDAGKAASPPAPDELPVLRLPKPMRGVDLSDTSALIEVG